MTITVRLPSLLLAPLLAGLLSFALPLGAASPAVIEDGQKYVMATHSFSVFIAPNSWRSSTASDDAVDPGPLAALAAERGKTGHEALAIQMIGGSTPMQHWNQGGGDESQNIAKVALRKGGVDVFTLSPNRVMPEPAIDLFGDLVIETNPDARILVQSSWAAWDGNGTTLRNADGERPPRPSFVNEDRDKTTAEIIDGWLNDMEGEGGYLTRLRAQLAGIDQRAGKEITFVVPSAAAVYALRKQILEGKVPGISKQSDIFRDSLGHVGQPGINLVTYVWYATIYRENPLGLFALVDANESKSAERETLLQKIAWNAVVQEAKSGVTGEPYPL